MNIQAYISYWYSLVVIRLASLQTKACFRDLEKTSKRLKKTQLHQKFNYIHINVYIFKAGSSGGSASDYYAAGRRFAPNTGRPFLSRWSITGNDTH